jgi:hypothetical protein
MVNAMLSGCMIDGNETPKNYKPWKPVIVAKTNCRKRKCFEKAME